MNVALRVKGRLAQLVPMLIVSILIIFLGLQVAPRAARAQGVVSGRVVESQSGEPLPGAAVVIQGTELGVLTDSDGAFTISGVPEGARVVEARALGHRSIEQSITVSGGAATSVEFALSVRPIELGGIRVEVLRPDLAPRAELTDRQVREANPKDSGQLLRELDGVDAVRRGPLGLDPVVRGLRETEVGTYLDGTRLFPAGPARMDSPLTHLDPSAVESIEVVKGPYALTWGAGNLSAIRVETAALPGRGDETPHGSVSAGYDSNLQAPEVSGSMSGRSGGVAVMGHGAWREGSDYTSGDGTLVPADFLSWEGRGRVGFDVAENSVLSIFGGYQWQEDLDYPGRLLNADFFKTLNLGADLKTERPEGLLRAVELGVYRNRVDHHMGNWDKPTALANPNRTPPFPLDIRIDSQIEVLGGRASAELLSGPWGVLLGGDVYSANRNATRVIRNADNGTQVGPTDLMWPDATITDVGLYTRINRTLSSGLRLSGTIRLDQVSADAGVATDFFLENVSSDLKADETNLSGAVTAGFDLNSNWGLSLGAGSAVRTADATERYSDRIPATKAQMTAEFVGNPQLDPERSTQFDIWLEGNYPAAALQLNVFYRTIGDYITLRATDPPLPTRLPLSPPTVFQYINGDATFYGAEASVAYALSSVLTADIGGAYLWGQEALIPPGGSGLVDRAALGIAPTRLRFGLRYEEVAGRFFLEASGTAVADQERVSSARNENRTPGYATIDLLGGFATAGGASIRLGVQNLLDREYWNHLNARNPFTGSRIPEPGTVIYLDVSYTL